MKLNNIINKLKKNVNLIVYLSIILLVLLGMIIYKFSRREKVEEGFTWTKKSIHDFLLIQHTKKPHNKALGYIHTTARRIWAPGIRDRECQ